MFRKENKERAKRSRNSKIPEKELTRDDLIMVNISTIRDGFGSHGVWVFFFEKCHAVQVFAGGIKIKLDSSITDKPIVEIGNLFSTVEQGLMGREITVTFKDREQMKEYWVV
ncbi:MAG: hypothetical protein A2Z68_02065 [Candidatus Nealsonbacteria bacterium RBG_13_38_11]|uniref:Uncharacterized protein n=1 Tax=Candidatus Nealsonbacteria bacterium RBG_13_38_11 TaxID=1801662 RepID=A0A1G2DXX1_9BACT|nr:MAG: hypothetical protein A2Z68_02065 [Candidatus Nealsonbacteria bacterium RBG_13_38_11]HXK32258.1 hypothetical protein [Candidatus Paceibacterota bacterium]